MTIDEFITMTLFRMHQLFSYLISTFTSLSISQNINNAMKGHQNAQFPKVSTQKINATHDLNMKFNISNNS